ncbi:MAG: TRAP transporter large permease subunit [Deltaproteobacteria bacterium]|nr:TRAP transporter large permease subunit [Deltaproteobacteria bacterium]
MDPLTVGIFGFFLLLVLLFAGAQIGVAMGVVGVLGFGLLAGVQPALGLLKSAPYSTFSSFDLCVIPLFVLMGNLAATSGLGASLYRTAYTWIGHLKGGLAMATVGASAAFAAICGSAIATTATFGTLTIPEMKKYNYNSQLAGGCVAAGGSIGVLIPPSIILVVYGIITESSIGKLFLAGFIPGIMEAVMYFLTIKVIVSIRPDFGPRGPKTTINQKVKSVSYSWDVAALFLLVIGGIYTGLFTPSEAAGIGATGAFISLIFRGQLNWGYVKEAFTKTTVTTGMVFWILLGAILFGYFLTISQVPNSLATWIINVSPNRYIVLSLMLVLLVILGALMDEMAIMLLTLPIIYPIILHLEFDPIWFGIIMTRTMEIGMIAPPVGINVFVLAGVTDIPMGKIYKGIIPFLITDLIQVFLLVVFPQICLFLPQKMA